MNKALFILTSLGIITLIFKNEITHAQTPVHQVYSDFGGFWTSSSSSISTTSPNNTHHLIGFRTGTTVWSTGVANSTLTANNIIFSPQNFEAMPATVSSNGRLLGVGALYGGSGCVTAPYGNNASAYLTDGIHGLNLATAIFNSGGTMTYSVSNLTSASIGDGVPDIIITQVGDYTSGTNDRFRFLNSSGAVVGVPVDVDFTHIPKVSNLNWKFYTRGTPPTCGGSTAGNRDFRMLAFDLADLGINASNYSQISRFEHQASSRSDIAFIAYNTFSVEILPITLARFNASLKERTVELLWETEAEINNDYFTIDRSSDGKIWKKISAVNGAGNSTKPISYQEIDFSPLSGVSYYRLSQTDFNGKKTYLNTIVLNREESNIRIYPNPAESLVTIESNDIKTISIINLIGRDVSSKISFVTESENMIQLDISNLESGIYMIQSGKSSYPLIIK